MTDPSRVRISGSLQPFAAGFGYELARQGYTPRSVVTQLHLMAHVSRWLHAQDLDVADLPGRTQQFLQGPAGRWLQASSDGQGVTSVADAPP